MSGGGDTPEETPLWKYNLGYENAWIAGSVINSREEIYNATIFAYGDAVTDGVVFDNSGKRGGTSDIMGNPWLQQRLADVLTEQLGKQVEYVEAATCPVDVGETLNGWTNAIVVT